MALVVLDDDGPFDFQALVVALVILIGFVYLMYLFT